MAILGCSTEINIQRIIIDGNRTLFHAIRITWKVQIEATLAVSLHWEKAAFRLSGENFAMIGTGVRLVLHINRPPGQSNA